MQRNLLAFIRPRQTIFRGYALGLGGGKKKDDLKLEEVNLDVEKDAKKLLSEVCGTNLLAEGGENIKIKADSEYPDWLWKIPTGKPLSLSELDPTTKKYWVEYYRLKEIESNYLDSIQRHKTVHK